MECPKKNTIEKSTNFGNTNNRDNYLYALDIFTGQQKWKYGTQQQIFSSPAISNGTMFFGSYDGAMYALE